MATKFFELKFFKKIIEKDIAGYYGNLCYVETSEKYKNNDMSKLWCGMLNIKNCLLTWIVSKTVFTQL